MTILFCVTSNTDALNKTHINSMKYQFGSISIQLLLPTPWLHSKRASCPNILSRFFEKETGIRRITNEKKIYPLTFLQWPLQLWDQGFGHFAQQQVFAA
jgi:hypothetical protein